VASSNEKDVETMPTQKIFKQRVRTRMAKTGESYTAARRQLMQKVEAPAATEAAEPATSVEAVNDAELLTSDDAMRRGTGRGHQEWFALLDAWGATGHSHTEIARWLHETQGVPGWWSQNVTVNYERARGMRSPGQMTDAAFRKRWLPGITLRSRPTRAEWTARFDWSDPPSRIVFTVDPKGPDKSLVAVVHEKLPDAEAAERLKVAWRAWLSDLKADLERG
jgi:hypothetical protein